jgi:transglutaminase-like putative cysteine protease
MPLLTIHHKTEYRYVRPVAFGEHRIMLRPRDGHDLRVLASQLDIAPQPMRLRWIHDVFGNSVAIATFDERSDTLSFTSTVTVEHTPVEEFALTPDDPAYFYPFLYHSDEFPDLQQFITPQYVDPNGELAAWARNFLDAEAPTPTFKILSGMTHGIREAFAYRRRHEHGTQHPLDTLQTGSGTCRDYALLMIEALRQLGIAARFVSGYLFLAGDRVNGYLGGGSTHAWVQVYLPSEGWIEFDPTNGIVGSRDLIRVAVARDPRQAVPLHGVYLGAADAFREMEVNISVVSADQEPTEQEQAVEAQVDRQPSDQEQIGQQQTDQAQTMSAAAEV